MTEQEALLAAILATPADDTPRLVYADYLDETAGTVECVTCNGVDWSSAWITDGKCPSCRGSGRVSDGRRERAAFIRVQCELARGKCEVHENATGCAKGRSPWCDWCLLGLRERELLSNCRLVESWLGWEVGPDAVSQINAPSGMWHGGWLIESENAPAGPDIMGNFVRGFVSVVESTWAAWRTHAAAITARQPVELVRLTTRPPDINLIMPGGDTGGFWWEIEVVGEPVRINDSERDYVRVDDLVRRRWPKIEFELPPADRWAHYVGEYTEVGPEELLRRMREAMAATEFQLPIASPARAVRRASRRARRP